MKQLRYLQSHLSNSAGCGALVALFAITCAASAAPLKGREPSLLTAFESESDGFTLGSIPASLEAVNPAPISLANYPRAGWQATLSTRAHGVRGTVRIVDADTFRVDNFFYDGGGINVHFILAATDDNNLFRTTRLVTDLNLLGTAHNFGSGTFANPVPEPTSAGLLVIGATIALAARRRPARGLRPS